MFELKVNQNTVHITGTTAAQSPCSDLVAKGDRMPAVGEYVNIHDAILNATAHAKSHRGTVCRHCLAAAKRL